MTSMRHLRDSLDRQHFDDIYLNMTAHEIIDTLQKHRISVDEFLLLDREGAFGDRNTELFDGEVFYMNSKYSDHARCMTYLSHALFEQLKSSEFEVLTDVSVRISDYDCPEPDLVICSKLESNDIVPLGNVKLAIEIAATTLRIDLGPKANLYANAGIAEYWVVDVEGKRLTQMWAPQEASYQKQREIAFGDNVKAQTISDLSITLPIDR